jgi:predicted nucleotidyltransferase
MPNNVELTSEKIANYRATALRRRQLEEPEIELRRHKAWEAARKAARILRQRFIVSRVVVFGSLARESGFTLWSDVDVAVWGLAPEDTFRAIGAVLDMETEVPVNLVDINTARKSLREVIEQEGISL